MQKTFGAALGVLLLCGGVMAHAGEQPVVIELYTSQGCSSCPPADELVTELSRQPGVLPLALHVDYWDYIGWADQFADPDYTKRQKAYARATGQITIYTPQMVIDGRLEAVGSRRDDVEAAIGEAATIPAGATISIANPTKASGLLPSVWSPRRDTRPPFHHIMRIVMSVTSATAPTIVTAKVETRMS